jgi:hypothetical protein
MTQEKKAVFILAQLLMSCKGRTTRKLVNQNGQLIKQ